MRWRVLSAALAPALIGVVMSSCANRKVWVYVPQAVPRIGAPLLDKSVVVTPLEDARPKLNRDYRAVGFIPLMPFGWQDLERPEVPLAHLTTTFWLFRPSEDLAKAIAGELARARIFRGVSFARGPTQGDLVLQGRLVSTKFKGLMFTYGLSIVGEGLWLLGLPAARLRNDLELEFVLRDSKTAEVLMKGNYVVREARLAWVYYLFPDFDCDQLLAEIARMVVADMEKTLPAGAVGK